MCQILLIDNMKKEDKLLRTLADKYHDGNLSEMARHLKMNRNTLVSYLLKYRVYNKVFISKLRKAYGSAFIQGGVSDSSILTLMEE